jgi:hypothetical protein
MTNRHDAIRAETRRVLEEGGQEAAFRYLRDAGVSPMLATLIFGLAAGISSNEAKHAMHASPAWSDVTEPIQALLEQIPNDPD